MVFMRKFSEGLSNKKERNDMTNWSDITFGVPDKFGNSDFVEVLCKVKTPDGYCKHMVLRFDEDGNWWMYLPRLGPAFGGGWCGIGDTRILEWAYIED